MRHGSQSLGTCLSEQIQLRTGYILFLAYASKVGKDWPQLISPAPTGKEPGSWRMGLKALTAPCL